MSDAGTFINTPFTFNAVNIKKYTHKSQPGIWVIIKMNLNSFQNFVCVLVLCIYITTN